MLLFRSLAEYSSSKPCVLTLGFFDGVHLGHQDLLKRLVKEGRDNGLESLVLTFDLRPCNRQKGLLASLEQRLELLGTLGPDTVVVQPFTREFAALEPEEFLKKVAVGKLGAKIILAGYDCRFGQGARGDYATMQECASALGYVCHQEEPLRVDGKIVSTTTCRQLLLEGNLKALEARLGRLWHLSGIVEHGRGLGRELGFPTANINIDGLALPPGGVYFASSAFGRALLYLGTRPTFGGLKEPVAEAFLLEGCPCLYGRRLSVAPVLKLGEERAYGSPEELKSAIAQYVQVARSL